MKAVILVGGEGTRLRPLTCNRPKPMVPLVNRPFLHRMLEYLKGHDLTDVVLALWYLPDQIQSYFGDGSGFGIRLTYVIEPEPLGTAGAVKNAVDHLDDTCFVFNGDVLTDFDLTAMLAFHRSQSAKVTIGLTPVENPTLYGLVETDSAGRVQRFVEKPSPERVTTNLINAGIYILEPETLEAVPENSFYMFERGLFPHLIEQGAPVFGYPSDAYWIDIGTPEKYRQVHRDILLGRIAQVVPGEQQTDAIWVGEGSAIDPTASLEGPVVLGRNCSIGPECSLVGPVVLGDGCRVGRGATLQDSILWEETAVGAGASVVGSLIGDGCWLAERVVLAEGTVVGQGVVIETGNQLDHGAKLWPGKHLAPHTITF